MKKVLLLFSIILGTLLLGNTVSAETGIEEYGGWSDEEGYYQKDEALWSTYAYSSSPMSHRSRVETKVDKGKGYERVVAETTWPGVYHYSQAWYQDRVWGTKYHTNRVWGTGYSIAKSGWNGVSITENITEQRRTSYGR